MLLLNQLELSTALKGMSAGNCGIWTLHVQFPSLASAFYRFIFATLPFDGGTGEL